MKIRVEHEVPHTKGAENECLYPGDFWGKPACSYHVRRDRMHGRKQPPERNVPKCTLFNKWLPGAYKKCPECMAICKAQYKEET